MKHPTQEQWMEFLYGELPRPRRNDLEKHLKDCEPCRNQRAEYEQTKALLGSWQIGRSATVQTQAEWPRFVKWAAAAAFLVTTGFATARFSTPALRPEVIEAQVTEPLREKITRELDSRIEKEFKLVAERSLEVAQAQLWRIAEKATAEAQLNQEQFAAILASLKERDTALYAELRKIQAQNQTTARALREDLEKVALFTDQSVRSPKRQIVELTSMTQSEQ